VFTTSRRARLASQVLVSKRVDRLIRESKKGKVVITKIVPESRIVRFGDVKRRQRGEFVHASAEVLNVLTLDNPRTSVLVHDDVVVVVHQGHLGFAALDDASDQLWCRYRGGSAVHRRRERAHDLACTLRGVLLNKGYIFRKTSAESGSGSVQLSIKETTHAQIVRRRIGDLRQVKLCTFGCVNGR